MKDAKSTAKEPHLKENKDKNYILAVALSFLVGSIGVDRFYLGYTATGVLKLVTLGGLGIWSLVDFLLIVFGKLKAKDSKLPLEAFNKYAKTFKMVAIVVTIVNALAFIAISAFLIFTLTRLPTVESDSVYQNYDSTLAVMPNDAASGCGIPEISSSASSTGAIGTLTRSGATDATITIPARNGGASYKVTADTMIFDSTCTAATSGYLFEGDSVFVFAKANQDAYSTGETLPAAVIIDLTQR